MNDLNYQLNDIVEMKKEHPCNNRTKLFQIVMLGADVKIKCLGCGNLILMSRDSFNQKFKKVVQLKQN